MMKLLVYKLAVVLLVGFLFPTINIAKGCEEGKQYTFFRAQQGMGFFNANYLPFALFLSKGKQEFTKTIKKEFAISSDGMTSLKNKYGQVEVRTWDKNRVKVEVTIIVKAGDESEAQGVFDRIHIDFSNDPSSVKAATTIQAKKDNWWGDWNKSKTEFKVNYEVFLPQDNSLELDNRYGDAFVEAINGDAKVNVKHGNFQLEGIGKDLKVNLEYGAGTIVKAREVVAGISYSKVRFKEVENIGFISKYSKVTVEKANQVKTDSRYDTYSLGEVQEFKCDGRYGDVDIASANSIVANSQYTDFYIERVGNRVDFDLQSGGVIVEEVAKGFSELSLIGQYTDYKIRIETGAIYALEANAEYAGISYPDDMNITYEKDKGVSHQVKGQNGSGSTSSVIKANLSYGGLRVK